MSRSPDLVPPDALGSVDTFRFGHRPGAHPRGPGLAVEHRAEQRVVAAAVGAQVVGQERWVDGPDGEDRGSCVVGVDQGVEHHDHDDDPDEQQRRHLADPAVIGGRAPLITHTGHDGGPGTGRGRRAMG